MIFLKLETAQLFFCRFLEDTKQKTSLFIVSTLMINNLAWCPEQYKHSHTIHYYIAVFFFVHA